MVFITRHCYQLDMKNKKQDRTLLSEFKDSKLSLPDFISTLEYSIIEDALAETGNNKVQTALMLMIPRPTLIGKMRANLRLSHKLNSPNNHPTRKVM